MLVYKKVKKIEEVDTSLIVRKQVQEGMAEYSIKI
jgi:hypothetical protein